MKHLSLLATLLIFAVLFSACTQSPRRGRSSETPINEDDAWSIDDTGTEDTSWQPDVSLVDVPVIGEDVPVIGEDVPLDADPIMPGCGNGVLEAGELCDPKIVSGPGACPLNCSTSDSCMQAIIVGSPHNCTAHCANTPLTACQHGDGCCPDGCTSANDNDCSTRCGDGVLDVGEACDPGISSGPGACPTVCTHANACMRASLIGTAANCTASCVFEEITQCINSDNCCPANCNANNDNNCASFCGNGIIEPGELCDGNCPTSCTPPNSCTSSVLSGSASTCSSMCTNSAITQCISGDGCCPTGCTHQLDSDCNCTPKTCAQLGVQCGETDNGCGTIIECQCGAGKSCVAGICETESPGTRPIGDACTNASQCSGVDAICITETNFKHGYCSQNCQTSSECPTGSHCGTVRPGLRICAKSCTDNTQCRADGYLCHIPLMDVVENDVKECAPAGTGTAAVGQPCQAIWQCSGGTRASCLTSYPGGYCTESCAFFTALCPNGSTCDSNNQCHKDCLTSLDCRSGYICRAGGGFSSNLKCYPQ
ncbi:MAG: hypothetical protein H0U74_03495 [Bradymonadaceae bacterium]|nr:hypothetical protein [Lujinxingiaceae bacterium]